MTGPHDSIIGVEIERGARPVPQRRCRRSFETATGNPRLNAVIIEADEQTGRATDIERLSYSLEELTATSDMSDLFDLPFEEEDDLKSTVSI